MPQPSGADRYVYERHRPQETPLYRIVETHFPRFLARLEAEGGSLPAFVKREFDDYLKCGLLEHGFLRAKCNTCSHEHLVAARRSTSTSTTASPSAPTRAAKH